MYVHVFTFGEDMGVQIMYNLVLYDFHCTKFSYS